MILSMLICDIICIISLEVFGDPEFKCHFTILSSSVMLVPGSDIIDKLTYDHYQILFHRPLTWTFIATDLLKKALQDLQV